MNEIERIASFLPQETINVIKTYGTKIPDDFVLEEEMTILFSDMRGFTELAESYEAHAVYQAINASLSLQTKIVTQYGGSINKFLGDGLLACFSGRQRHEQALTCLLALIEQLTQHEAHSSHLPCRVGFGMHDGKILLGLLGDEHRKEFTVIGDVANTAARLCGIAQPFQGLVTEACLEGIPDALRHHSCHYLDVIKLKGKQQGIAVFYVGDEC